MSARAVLVSLALALAACAPAEEDGEEVTPEDSIEEGVDAEGKTDNAPPANAGLALQVWNPTSSSKTIVEGCAGINLPERRIASGYMKTYRYSRTGVSCFSIDTVIKDSFAERHYSTDRYLRVGRRYKIVWNASTELWDFGADGAAR
jgi:hypothetical protein